MRKKLTPEEAVVRDLRRHIAQRKLHVVVSAVMLAIVGAVLVPTGYLHHKMNARITPENLRATISFEDLRQELPPLFCAFHRAAERNAERIASMYLFGAVEVFLCLTLIVVITGVFVRRSQFTLSLYERIGNLEAELAALRARLEGNGQQPGEGHA